MCSNCPTEPMCTPSLIYTEFNRKPNQSASSDWTLSITEPLTKKTNGVTPSKEAINLKLDYLGPRKRMGEGAMKSGIQDKQRVKGGHSSTVNGDDKSLKGKHRDKE